MEQKPEPTNKPEALSWDEALNEIATRFGYRNWDHLNLTHIQNGATASGYYKLAAHLFAESAFHRGAREQREICVEAASIIRTNGGVPCIDEGSILYAPEFKA